MTGSFSGGFLAFALVGGFGGAAALAYASREWQGIFIGRSGVALESIVVEDYTPGQVVA
jgi:MFS transporter, NNP family, nitrate/nitrite transporter